MLASGQFLPMLRSLSMLNDRMETSNTDEARGLRQRQDDGCLEVTSFQTASDWSRTFKLSMCCSPVPLKHGVSGADFGMSCRGKAKTATSLVKP
jgi:hypothetical protein